MNDSPPSQPRTGRELFDATIPFAGEIRSRTWWVVGSTLVLMLALLAGAALIPFWPIQLLCSVVGCLVMIRAFIIFHDYMHGTILRNSGLGRWLMYGVGAFFLTPHRIWRETHNHHHANVGRIPVKDSPVVITDFGAFPIMSVGMWRQASRFQRFQYRVSRHPVTILLAYITVFMGNQCLRSTITDFRKHWPGALVFLFHVSLIFGLFFLGGWQMMFFAYLLPITIASAGGAYLFYAQHNFPGARVYKANEWNYYEAALETASYFKLGRAMDWFTGSIGYHHVHHLNAKIPFYRLRDAMNAIPELQSPKITRLRPRDIYRCFQVNLWDAAKQRMVRYKDARIPKN
jgi:omega-6 fatty acid desaturase (delta-12 desaturase)